MIVRKAFLINCFSYSRTVLCNEVSSTDGTAFGESQKCNFLFIHMTCTSRIARLQLIGFAYPFHYFPGLPGRPTAFLLKSMNYEMDVPDHLRFYRVTNTKKISSPNLLFVLIPLSLFIRSHFYQLILADSVCVKAIKALL